MMPSYEYGDRVRVIRNVRNDGTFPGTAVGELLVRRGAVGYVRDVGTFLQDQIIYTVHFVEADKVVGCREQELQSASDAWIPNRFEFREKVTPTLQLSIGGEIIAKPGDEGEILKVLRDLPNGIGYHVRFSGRTLQVPETALEFVREADADDLLSVEDDPEDLADVLAAAAGQEGKR
jgi:nitrogen fixation protein NifZ